MKCDVHRFHMKKIMVFGTFDIFHRGHEFFLRTAKEKGYLIAVIARDKTVAELKNNPPVNGEKKRAATIKKSGLADKVVFGGKRDRFRLIRKYRPDIICLGYDQKHFIDDLPRKIKEYKLDTTRIIRLQAFKPEQFKSSKLKRFLTK